MESQCRLLFCLAVIWLLSCTQGQVLIDCDFENDANPLCGFTNDARDDADFKRSTGAGSSVTDSAPTFDHTLNTDAGHFLDTDLSIFGLGTKMARVVSQSVTLASTKSCLEFYYHMFGPALDSLHVYRKTGTVEKQIFGDTGNIGDFWNRAAIDIVTTRATTIQLIFEATISSGVRGDIALDDIKLSNGECSAAPVVTTLPPTSPPVPLASYDCTFDDPSGGICTPKPNPRNDFDWLFRLSGTIPVPHNQAPKDDHTTSSSTGLYLYVPRDSNQTEDTVSGEFRTALLQANSQPKCLRFYYYIKGTQPGQLNVYSVLEGSPPPSVMPWNRTGEQSGYWDRGLLDIPAMSSSFRVAFEANRPKDYNGCIAIDDLLLMDGRCPAEELFCDFEDSSLCLFSQDRSDDIDWVHISGSTPSYTTGPSFDHTTGNSTGFYMYIETSRVVLGHVARLISPVVTETHGHAHCLIFWYHMYGDNVDALNVLMANATTPTQRNLVWSLAGNRGDKWRAAEVHLLNSIDFMVIFEAFRGSGYQGDIAIDDVEITSTAGCPGEAGLKNYSSITCDFEEIEICYWVQDTRDDFDWTWQNGASQSLANTGPGIDHTTGKELGFYMYIQEEYLDFPGGTARLISPDAKAQPVASCLEFWYHMYGRDIESLKVYMMQNSATELPRSPVWSVKGDMGNYWHRATFNILVTNYAFKFVFEATRGQAYRDNIALDDVRFYEGADCPQFTTDAPMPTTTPVPIPTANCDFEDENDTMCGYTQSIMDEFDWSYGGRYPISKDHTLGTSSGHYLYIKTGYSYYQRTNDRADLYSPLLTKSDKPQCLQFYYYLFGYYKADFLMVYLSRWGKTLAIDPHFSIYGSQGQQWNLASVDIPPMDSNFQVVFEAMYSPRTKVAIDDITFNTGVCSRTTPTPLAGGCDFERGIKDCGYQHDFNQDFHWLKHSGATSSKGTGPSVDHTTGTKDGYYMYIEASLPQRPGQKARIISPTIYKPVGADMCSLFYYHMRGPDVGEIHVYIKPDQEDTTSPLLVLSGDSKDMWRPASIDLTSMKGKFQIILEGVVGSGVKGDMAIDDISIRWGPCPGYAKEAQADFEMPGGMNGFIQYWIADTYWKWYDYYLAGNSLLPGELKAGDGAFMYIDGPASKPDTWATLLSPVMAGHTNQHCLDFDYAIYKDGRLLISIWQQDGVAYDLMIKDTPTAWTHERRTLSKAEVGRDFMILFSGIVGKNKNGYIALDNPVIREYSCDEVAEPGSPAQSSSGSAVAPTVILVIVLAAVLATVLGVGFFLYRRRRLGQGLPTVAYSTDVSRDLTITNPNYDNAALQSHA